MRLREECRLTVFEYSVLRRAFRPNRQEVETGWTGLHNEELRNSLHQYYLGDQIKEDEMGGSCRTYVRDDKFLRNFGRKT
jgi:hypothetical protein